ncbi:hypothetical protein CR513_31477, partial [Mucuna pruriens]
MSVPIVYWGKVFLIATYLINKLPTRVLQVFHVVFGCVAFVHSHNLNRSKLDPRAIKCTFIGYPSNKKDIRVITLRIVSSLYQWMSSFTKHNPSLSDLNIMGESILEVKSVSGSLPLLSLQDSHSKFESFELEVNAPECDNDSKEVIMPIALRKGKRSCVSFIATIDVIKILASVQETMKYSNWVQAMREEMKVLERNSTWNIVDKPKDERIVRLQ